MAVDIMWDRLVQPNISGNLMAGYEAGQAKRKETDTRNALGLYAQGDVEGAYKALLPVDPEKALAIKKMGAQEAAEAARKDTLGTYARDPSAARTRALQAGDIDTLAVIDKMDASSREQAKLRAEQQAALLLPLQDVPYEQRKALIAQRAPQLQAAGYTPEQISSFDPTDANLGSLVNQVLTIKEQLEQRWKAKEFDATQADRRADNERADRQVAIARRNSDISAGNLAQRRTEHAERKRQGGYGAPGAYYDPRSITWDDQ